MLIIHDFEERVENLLNQFKKHKTIIVAVDFDDTLCNLTTTSNLNPIIELIKECKSLGFKIVIYTARNVKDFYKITEFCNDNDIDYDAINKDVVTLQDPTSGKIYYNILLDDKAGLSESYNILLKVCSIIREGAKNKINEIPSDLVFNKDLLFNLINKNTLEYNIMKTLEESAELQEKLLKYLNKKDKKPTDSEIIEEIGDLKIRLEVLSYIFGHDLVANRIENKQNSINTRLKKYSQV